MFKTQAFALLLLVASVGCYATQANMKNARTDAKAGIAETYPGDCATHHAQAMKTVKKMGFDVLSSDESAGEIQARLPASKAGYNSADNGTRLAVWFDAEGDGCRVRAYARHQDALGGATGGDDWQAIFHRYYKRGVGYAKE